MNERPPRAKRLPKTFSDALVRKLSDACVGGSSCDLSCDGIGWCTRCWSAAAGASSAGASKDHPKRTA